MRVVDPVRIDGLREVQAALKAIDGESQKKLRLTLNDAATVVVKGAQRRAPVRTGALRNSIKVASSQREARVKEGSAKVPYAGFIDYGGRTGRNRATVRKFVAGGRIVYPAYYAQRANIGALLQKRLNELIAESGLKGD